MKKDIVISNHFTTKRADGSATRGATPGQFVMRYMSRDEKGATEPLAPFMLDSRDPFNKETLRYRARELEIEDVKAEQLQYDELDVKRRFKKIDGLGGRAFGSKNLSLSDQELREESAKVQAAFDQNHAVQLMVLSFSEKFLRDYGVLDEDFVFTGDGSYKNHYDQMKLRMAINRGVRDLVDVGGYENPVWVATLQVDTSHLHCHLALCDQEFADARTRVDGDDRGKIWEGEKEAFRHGIARELDLMRGYSFHRKNHQKDRENVVAFMKDLDFHEASYNRELQLVMGSLPVDRDLWNSQSTDRAMRYPNELARGFVQRLYHDYPEQTGYQEAFQKVIRVADSDEFIRNGQKELIDRGVDALYQQIKQVDQEELSVKTDLLKVQSMDDDGLKRAILERGARMEEFDPFGFELRTRAYTSRIARHTGHVMKQADALMAYQSSAASADASRMALYYETELLYHAETSDKYRSFFGWRMEKDQDVRDQYESVASLHEKVVQYDALLAKPLDEVLEQYSFESIEDAERNRQVFEARVLLDTGVTDAALLLTGSGRNVYQEHMAQVQAEYQRANQEYVKKAYEKGQLSAPMLVEAFREGVSAPYPPQMSSNLYSKDYFEEVKAHDLHDLDVDYYGQTRVGFSRQTIEAFADQYNLRLTAYMGARDYLEETGQTDQLVDATERDLYRMRRCVEQLVDGQFEVPTLAVELEVQREQLEETMTLDTNIDVLGSLRNELTL